MTVVAHDEAQSLKARIFSAAIAVFAEHRLSGARMEQIATEAQTTKRMVVYYFKQRTALSGGAAACVCADPRYRAAAGAGECAAGEALVRLVRWSVRYHATHADYMRVICMENMQRGKWLKSSGELEAAESYRPVDSGRHFTVRPAAGRLSGGVDARCPPVNQQLQLLSGVELHTFSSLYLDDPLPAIDDEAMVAHHCDIAVRAVIRFVIS